MDGSRFYLSFLSKVILVGWGVVLISQTGTGQFLKPCPGPCVPPHQCGYHGGRFTASCGPNRVCCEYGGASASCGHVARGVKQTNFKSPAYPSYSSGSLICKFDLEVTESTTGVRIDFLDLQMDYTPVQSQYSEENSPACDSDMFFIKGFKDWSPDPRCGNLTGYSTMVELEPGQPILSLVFVMSSFAYKWHVRLTQITHVEIQQAGQILDNKIFLSSKVSSPQSWNGGRRLNKLPRPDHTGSNNKFFGAVPLIGGGEDAKPNSIPWQASVQTIRVFPLDVCPGKNVSIHFCGGSIIDDTTILSAAHCFLSSSKYPHPLMDIADAKVVVGEHNLCEVDEVQQTRSFPIASVIFHYNYLSSEILNDVAIIKLATRIPFNEAVQPIALAYPGIQSTSMVPLLSGWGSYGTEENATYPPILQQTSSIEIQPDQQCLTSTINHLKLNPLNRLSYKYRSSFPRGLCTKGSDRIVEAGYGDSGGPLAVMNKNDQRYFLLGVVSHKRPEKDEKTGANYNLNYYAKVPDYGSWILMGLVPD